MDVPVRALKFTPSAKPKPSLLECAAEALVANPSASLAEVAQAAGIGRTTLHKQYATRQDLLVAVAHESLDALERAVEGAGDDLRRLVSVLIPLGARLAFLFRQPSLDAETEVMDRLAGLDVPIQRIVAAAQREGVLRTDLPDWWFVSTLYAQVYVAWESIACGRLAPLAAPDLVMTTLLSGLGGPSGGAHDGEAGRSGDAFGGESGRASGAREGEARSREGEPGRSDHGEAERSENRRHAEPAERRRAERRHEEGRHEQPRHEERREERRGDERGHGR